MNREQLEHPIRAACEVSGNIEGTANPVEAEPTVYVIARSDTLAFKITDTSNGYFKLIGLEEGTYDVLVNPRSNNYSEKTVSDVDVTIEETNNIGTVGFSQN